MSKTFGSKVDGKEAQAGLDRYRSAMRGSPYYRQSISYSIEELRAYLDTAEAELTRMGINGDDRCLTILPYLYGDDERMSILLTPSAYVPEPANMNGPMKHQFNKYLQPPLGNDATKDPDPPPPGPPDPENPFGGVPDPEDPYNHGQSNP